MTINNLGWCKPLEVLDSVLVFNEGKLISLFKSDVEVAIGRDTLLSMAKEVDQEFDSNNVKAAIQTIAEHGTELSCKDCPAYFECECWQD